MELLEIYGHYTEFAILLILSALIGSILVHLRQPVLIGYIIVGILVGPVVLGLVQAHDQIVLLSEMGVTVLLFTVGLKMDLIYIRNIGPVALVTGIGQLIFTIAFGFALILLIGKGYIEAIYAAVALTFSSTIIIVKLLSDKRELDSLHGRIAIGFLIVQDMAVILAMMVIGTFKGDKGITAIEIAGSLALRLAAAAVVIFPMMRYVLPWLLKTISRSQELLLVFAIAWGAGLAILAELAGFSKEAGAFIAGFSFASTQYREAVNARLSGIKDFLLLFFFIELGAMLNFSVLRDELWPAVALSAFVLIGNPLIVMLIMGYMGYRKRTGFLAGLTVAQISEFSIVFVAMGISLNHIGVDVLGLITIVGLITITVSTYMIRYSQQLYEWLQPCLRFFERSQPYRELAVESQRRYIDRPDIIIFGVGRYGSRLIIKLQKAGIRVLGVDFDPETVRRLLRHNFPMRFGDAENPELLSTLPLEHTKWVVTTLPQLESNRAFLNAIRQTCFRGKIAGMVRDDIQASTLKTAGVDRVVNPFNDAADYASNIFIEEIRKTASPS